MRNKTFISEKKSLRIKDNHELKKKENFSQYNETAQYQVNRNLSQV